MAMAEPPEREQVLFRVLTAVYHRMPEADALIAELTHDECRLALRDAAHLIRGLIEIEEIRGRVPRGAALPRLIELVRLDREGGEPH